MSHKHQDQRAELLSRLSLALVRPAFAGNVGAVSRVMTNFGVRRGILVSPRCDINSIEARQFATGPSAVTLATMLPVKSLKDCIDGAISVVGMTRRTGHLRKPSLTISGLVSRLQQGAVIIVFGPEESGLSDDEIHQCTDILSLDVSDAMPSLNLSHAVAVVLSRVFDQAAIPLNEEPEVRAPIQADELLALFARFSEALTKLEASGKISNAERYSRILSQSLSRTQLDSTELSAWHGLIALLS